MTGFVYAIAAGDLVKIGFSTNPARRLNKVASDNAHSCVLLGYMPATKEDEAELHRRFAPAHVRGEWFKRSEEVDAFIASLPPVKKSQSKYAALTRAGAILAKFGGPAAVASIFGVEPSGVYKWAYPRPGYPDGSIPAWWHQRLYDHARQHGIDLKPSDFFAQAAKEDA